MTATDRLRSALYEAGNFACLNPDDDGEPCVCCLHGSAIAAAALAAWSSRDPACVARWPECESGAHDPRCCRFPKSCSPIPPPPP